MDPQNFFDELKRRNVYKVAVTYAVIAWLLIQIAAQLLPIFEIPSWVIRAVILLLVVGCPIALVVAWAFELTPEGIKRTDDVPLRETIAPEAGPPWRLGAISLTLLNVALQISDYKNRSLAIGLAIVALCLLLPSLKGKGTIAWNSGKQTWGKYGESNPTLSTVTALLIGMTLGGTLLGAIWWGFKSTPSQNPTTAETNPRASPAVTQVRYVNWFTAREIYDILSKADLFHKDDVAKQFENGMADWTLTFSSAQKLREDPSRIIVVFNPAKFLPPSVRCEAQLRGNEYLGRMKSDTFTFRVQGLIREIDWENNRITLAEASFYQVPAPTATR